VPYAPFGGAFLGATFDVTPLYRLNAVMRWRKRARLTTAKTRAHAHRLQARFVRGLGRAGVRVVSPAELVVPLENVQRGQFLTFRTPKASQLVAALAKRHVVVDARGDRLRFGFGVAQDEGDVDALLERMSTLRPR
jgi:selenocysteine lyase/cysteine desulfurase